MVLLMAKIVALLVKGQEIKSNREHYNGVPNPLASFLLVHKEVGKSCRVKVRCANKVQVKYE